MLRRSHVIQFLQEASCPTMSLPLCIQARAGFQTSSAHLRDMNYVQSAEYIQQSFVVMVQIVRTV